MQSMMRCDDETGTKNTQQPTITLNQPLQYYYRPIAGSSSQFWRCSRRGISLVRATAKPESRVCHSPWRKNNRRQHKNTATMAILPLSSADCCHLRHSPRLCPCQSRSCAIAVVLAVAVAVVVIVVEVAIILAVVLIVVVPAPLPSSLYLLSSSLLLLPSP